MPETSIGAAKAAGASRVRDTLNNLFEATVLRCDSLRGTGERCGRSTTWVWRQLRQNKSVDLVKVATVLTQLEVPLRFFFEEIADASPATDPAWTLRHLCQTSGPHDPFLAELEERIERLAGGPFLAAKAPRRLREIAALEARILADPEAAKIDLERLAGDLLATAEMAAADGVPRGLLADCALALLGWSEARRECRHAGDGVAACALAGRLAEAAGDRQARGSFYLQGSRLLTDFARPGQALRFARIACCLLQHGWKSGRLAAAMVQQSIALAKLGQSREARIEALAALRLAARTDWRSRGAAWLQLAELAFARNASRRQLACLARAGKLARGAGRLAAILGWRQAVALGRLGRVKEANRAFRAAISYFEKKNQPFDAARVAADHFEMSLRNGGRPDALKRVRASSPCFEQLGSDSRAFELWMDLAALLYAGGSKTRLLEQVAAVRAALEVDGITKEIRDPSGRTLAAESPAPTFFPEN